MSRTESHKPWFQHVKAHPEAYHFHPKGICTLVPLDQFVATRGKPVGDNKCYWIVSRSWVKQHNTCSCWMCRFSENRNKEKNRRIRQEGKRESRSDEY